MKGRYDSGESGWNYDLRSHFKPGRTQGICGVAQGPGHRNHGVLAERRDHRHDHQSHHEPRAQGVEDDYIGKDPLHDRGHERQRKVAIHDGGYPGEDFEDRFKNSAQSFRRVLGQENRRAKPPVPGQRSRPTPATSKVPPTSGSTPKFCGLNRGVQTVPPRNSQIGISPKKPRLCLRRTITMPTVVIIDMAAAARRDQTTTHSSRCRRRRRLVKLLRAASETRRPDRTDLSGRYFGCGIGQLGQILSPESQGRIRF